MSRQKKISYSAFDEALSKPLMTPSDSDCASVASTVSSSTASSSYRKSLPAGFAGNTASSRDHVNQYHPPHRRPLEDESTYFTGHPPEQHQQQQETVTFLEGNSLDLDTELARERAAEMSMITGSMRTIKQIYEDLAVIVDEQQDDIDDIEMNASQTMLRAEEGMGQLEKAASLSSSNQRSHSRCMTIFLTVVVATIGVFIVRASIKHHHHHG